MRILYALWCAIVCMTIHRNLKMVHVQDGSHLITCNSCGQKDETARNIKNEILTYWYFNRSSLATLIFLPVFFLIGGVHLLITRRTGGFEYPPEHHKQEWDKSLI